MLSAHLGLGPMSPEIISAIYKYSHLNKIQLMLIASMNQINYLEGYVGGWNTFQYKEYLDSCKTKYPDADIIICRDHCGPNFAWQDIDPYKTIETDIQAGFDLIHIDWSRSADGVCNGTREAMRYAKSLNPNILLEIGTDPIGGPTPTRDQVQNELNAICTEFTPEFYVVNTGSLVKDYNQAGHFNKEAVNVIHDVLQERGIKLKEHNDDYLSNTSLGLRKGIVDALNIAPQLGVIQTLTTLYSAKTQRITDSLIDAYINKAVDSGNWKQWADKRHGKTEYAIMAGHYRFNSDEYRALTKALYENPIEQNIFEVINKYVAYNKTVGK